MSKKSADMGEEKAWGGGCQIWYYQLGSFKTRDTKDFGIKINIPKEKLLNFENWTNGEPQ